MKLEKLVWRIFKASSTVYSPIRDTGVDNLARINQELDIGGVWRAGTLEHGHIDPPFGRGAEIALSWCGGWYMSFSGAPLFALLPPSLISGPNLWSIPRKRSGSNMTKLRTGWCVLFCSKINPERTWSTVQ